MPKAVSVEVMRQSDAWTIEHEVPSKELMARAGKGIYDSAKWEAPVAIVCGSGNNAGDGYVVAGLLKDAGIECTIVLLSGKFSEDGRYYYNICLEKGIKTILFSELISQTCNSAEHETTVNNSRDIHNFSVNSPFSGFNTILDCILGTGFSGEVRGNAKEAIEAINLSDAYVISADINSGLNGDTGMGTTYVISDLTVSIGEFKLGHFKGLSKTAMKEKVNVDIGIKIQGESVEIS